MPRNPIISTCAGTDDKPRAEQIHLFCRGAKEEKPAGLNWWRTCELCVRVHTTNFVTLSVQQVLRTKQHPFLRTPSQTYLLRLADSWVWSIISLIIANKHKGNLSNSTQLIIIGVVYLKNLPIFVKSVANAIWYDILKTRKCSLFSLSNLGNS